MVPRNQARPRLDAIDPVVTQIARADTSPARAVIG
jgi:hypothetical protein